MHGPAEVHRVTQKSVEIVIGKLASDEELRRRFRHNRLATLRSLAQEQGLELTTVEVASLEGADADAFERLAEALDPRVQKASLRPNGAARGARDEESR
jgi:hypothetical protein